jgi:hypothetical protein
MTTPSLALTLGQIKTRVKRTFGDTGNVEIRDSDIVDWVNAATRDLVKYNNLNKIKATSLTVANQSDYDLPVGVSGLSAVKYQGATLEYVSLDSANELFPERDNPDNFPTGTPLYYWVYADKLTLYPAPNSVEDLTLYYTVLPQAVDTDDDVPGVPVEYHNRIIDYCLAQAYELNGDLNASQIKMNQFTEGRREMSGKPTEAETGPYPFITDLSEYEFDYN